MTTKPIPKSRTFAIAIDDDLENQVGATNPLPVTSASGNVISTVNSRAASTLAAAATFQGTSEDVSAYGRVGVSIVSDNATDGTLTMEVSRDGTTWGGPTRTWSDTRFAQPHMWNIVEKYFRIKYVNGTTEATNLAIQTQYSNNSDILLGHQLNETLLDETEAIITRSVAVGKNPDGDYTNALMTTDQELFVTSSATENDVRAVIANTAISSTAYHVLVDLSDTTNFPHDYTGRIDLTQLKFAIDPASNSVGAVKVGVITRIDGTNADIEYAWVVPFGKNPARILSITNFNPSQMKMGQSGGSATHFLSSDVETSIAAVNTGASLSSPNGSIAPGLGDVVVKFLHTSGSSWDAQVSGFYHSHA